jgi:type IV pilus assembly protein PilX
MNLHFKPYTVMQSKQQKGVVLFVALIALVVMSLAAVALIRSVDTSTIIAGNLATKQSATTSGDSGIETALNWMSAVSNPTTFNANSAAQAYYATSNADPMTFAWNAADSLPADDVSGVIDANGTDASGNTVRYVVQRMCRNTGLASPGNCLFGAPVVGTSSLAVVDLTGAGAGTSTEQSPLYRVTARVVGPKNTVSFLQAFVY